MSNFHDKFSLENLDSTAAYMSRSCSVCCKTLSKSNPGIPCFSCGSKIHTKCSNINDPKITFHLFKGNWKCSKCLKDQFPFTEIDNDTLIDLVDIPEQKTNFSSEYSIDDKLKLLLSCSSKSNWYDHVRDNEPNPDESEFGFESEPNFHYYNISDFRKSQETWN